MRIYPGTNVFDEAIKRINWLFDEFEHVMVSFSGGKDSTVILNLALMVAEQRGRLPLTVMFLDQEAEWTCVKDYIKSVMYDKRVNPYWMQIPFRLFNANSSEDSWLQCWNPDEKEKWLHQQDPISKKENKYKVDRFAALFNAVIATEFKGQRTANLGGVRTQESPARYLGLTTMTTYKGATWGKILSSKLDHYTFYPIYDWGYKDVWKAILDNNWRYCTLYDSLYQYGVPVMAMRVSNVHHETAVQNLYFLQELDGALWSRLTKRLQGVNTAGQLQKDCFTVPKKLPYMFVDWFEYRDYLLDKLITDKELTEKFKTYFRKQDKIFKSPLIALAYNKACIAAIFVNDAITKISNFEANADIREYRAYIKGVFRPNNVNNRYIQDYNDYKRNIRTKKFNKGTVRFSTR